jgi:hypothetical protein
LEFLSLKGIFPSALGGVGGGRGSGDAFSVPPRGRLFVCAGVSSSTPLGRSNAWATANGHCARTPGPPAPVRFGRTSGKTVLALKPQVCEHFDKLSANGVGLALCGVLTRCRGRWWSSPGAGPIRRCHRGGASSTALTQKHQPARTADGEVGRRTGMPPPACARSVHTRP